MGKQEMEFEAHNFSFGIPLGRLRNAAKRRKCSYLTARFACGEDLLKRSEGVGRVIVTCGYDRKCSVRYELVSQRSKFGDGRKYGGNKLGITICQIKIDKKYEKLDEVDTFTES